MKKRTIVSVLEELGQSKDIKKTFDTICIGCVKRTIVEHLKEYIEANALIQMSVTGHNTLEKKKCLYIKPMYFKWKLTAIQSRRLYNFLYKPKRIIKIYEWE